MNMPMIVLKKFPPNFQEIHKALKPEKGTVFCYGPIIYNPDGVHLDYPLVAHEEVHARQQGKDPESWWKRYLVDEAFRLSQEVPAYQVQFREGKRILKDRNQRAQMLSWLAKELSGSRYGEMITYAEAYKAIANPKLYAFE